MQNIRSTRFYARTLERFLATLAFAVCIITLARIWQVVSSFQPMWLLPALYFLEIVAVSVLGWLAIALPKEPSAWQIALVWSVVGVFSAFIVLGALSIWFVFIPTAVHFSITALLAERRRLNLIPMHLLLCIVLGIAQGGLILAIAARR